MEHAPVILKAIKLGATHYDRVRDPAQGRWKKARGRPSEDNPDIVDSRTMEDKGYILRRRSEVQSGEEIVEAVRHKGEALPRRPRNRRQTSSMDRGGATGRYRRDTGGYGLNLEGSAPPRGRKARPTGARSRRGRSSSSTSTSSSSSPQLGSSSGEEDEMKKLYRKKWITAGLASVATFKAASKAYQSIEDHDKRVVAVHQGNLLPEEAHKQGRSARWQDAAAIALAALGIKGAISEWKGMAEEHEKHKELCEKHEQQHKRRIEHLHHQRAKDHGGCYKGRDKRRYYDGPVMQDSAGSERRVIEAPPERSRSGYGRDSSRSRARSYKNRDDTSHDRNLVRR